jgi:hypothetical protein
VRALETSFVQQFFLGIKFNEWREKSRRANAMQFNRIREHPLSPLGDAHHSFIPYYWPILSANPNLSWKPINGAAD